VSAGQIDIRPQPRIDTLATDATGRSRRRSEYTGTIVFGGQPEPTAYGIGTPRPTTMIDTQVFLPDSLPYRPDPLEDALVACSVAVQGAEGGGHRVLDSAAGLAPDPRNPAVCWIRLHVVARTSLPFAVSYRVDALVAMNAILAEGDAR
jgi:hypothetical protein